MYTYALFGMEVYAETIKFNENNEVDSKGESPRVNFDNVFDSLITIFIVLTGETWPDHHNSHRRGSSSFTSLFFIVLYIIGNMILLNLFLAILLKNFD
jgi:hypothetical protein